MKNLSKIELGRLKKISEEYEKSLFKSNIVIGKESVDRMIYGIKCATDAIRLSYGPKGCNAVVESIDYPFHEVANDAQTIIQAIQVEDPVAKRGLGFLKELSDKVNRESGDGRKTTCIIAETILTEGKEIGSVQLKEELDALIPLIESKIDEQTKQITVEEISKVATIASESREIGDRIGEIYKEIGQGGIIQVEASGTFNTTFSITNGIRFHDTGFLSPYMVYDEAARKENRKENQAVYLEPTILVTKRKISHLNDINPLLEALQKQNKKDLVIFTDDMDSGVASILVKAHRDKVINICIIKAPVLWKNYVFEDFAKVVGATIVEDATGINFKNLTLECLGTCGKIVVDKDETIITGGADISEHLMNLKKQGDNDSLLRLQWLQTKTAILKLGANSESELSYKRLKTNDAINASRLALESGVVAGGGICLYNVARTLPDTEAGKILKTALEAPIRQIMANQGHEWNKYEVLVDGERLFEGIFDASKVLKNAIRNAIALASTILTSQIVITITPKSQEELAMMQLQANRRF